MPVRTIRGLPVLELSGSPEEMGAEHGALFREQIGLAVDGFLKRGAELFGTPYSTLCRDAVRCVPFIPDELLRELRALADASGRAFDEILALNCLVDVDAVQSAASQVAHCCNFAAGPPATKDGLLVHGRNLDFPHAGVLPRVSLLISRRPSNSQRHPTLGVAWAGNVGFFTACNAARLSLGEVGTPVTNPTLEGVPFALLLREMLETCGTLDACRDHVRVRPRTCGFNLLICSGSERAAGCIESTPSLFAWRRSRKGRLAVDGVCLCAETGRDRLVPPANAFRHARITELLSMHAGEIDVPLAFQFLRDRHDLARAAARGRGYNCICNEFTVHSALFLPAEHRLYVSHGSVPAPEGEYHEIRLDDLWPS